MLYNVPPRNPIFTGREKVLANLPVGFQQSPLVLLYGPKGWGKTQIALEYCYRSSMYTTILWLNASSRALLYRDARTIANQLSLSNEPHGDEPHLFFSLKQWVYHQTAWLLVLDHINDLSLLELIVPLEPKGHLLMTTRLAPFGSSPSSPAPSDLNERTLLLLQQAGFIVEQRTAERPLSKTVNTIGASLTKALVVFEQRVAAFLAEGIEPEAAYRQEAGTQLLEEFARLLPAPLLELLHVLTFFYPEAISQEVLLKAPSEEIPESLSSLFAHLPSLEKALQDLVNAELLLPQEEDKNLLHVHPGLETVLIESLTNNEQRAWASMAVLLINHAFPQVRFDTWDDCQRALPLARRCATLITKYQLPMNEGALLLERLGSYCLQRAFYAEAETFLTQALEWYEQHLSAETLDAAQAMNSLALLSSELARYQKAEALHLHALEIREQELGSDDPKTAESLHNLAIVYGDLGHYQRAEELYLRVLSLEERRKGADHPDVASTLNNLGLIYYHQGRDAPAETAFRRVLAIYEHALPANHPYQAYPLDGLGALAERQGHLKRAEAFYQRALVVCQHTFGEQHPETAHSINRLADIAESQGNDLHAKELYLQALSIGELTLGPEHPDVALILKNLAFLTTKQGQYVQAEPLYQRALSIYERTFGSEHPLVADVLNNQGQLFRKTGDLDRAEALLRQALSAYEQAMGRTHPETALILVNLADVLSDRVADEEAELLLQRALALRQHALGPNHAEVASVQEKLVALQKRRDTTKKDGE